MTEFEHAGSTWAFVIDTDSYSGNFERKLTAFCTGYVGEGGVGDDLSDEFYSEVEFDPFYGEDGPPVGIPSIVEIPDEDGGYLNCCSVHSSPGWFNDGMGNLYRVGDHPSESDMIEVVHESLLSVAGESHPEDVEREVVIADLCRERLVESGMVDRHPCYNSVAIYFDSRPTREQVDVIVTRAHRFFSERKHGGISPVIVEGFRMVERIVTLEDRPLYDDVESD